jgi:hypothetical protein
MVQLLNHVEPGQIITADEWNLVVDVINELIQSGQTTGIEITTLMPAGTEIDPIRIGTLQQVNGQSFGYSIGQSTVTFQGQSNSVVIQRSDMLLGSSDTRLLFMMPPIPGLSESGEFMSLRVDNGVAHDVHTVFVQPIVSSLSGDIFIERRSDITPNPNPNPLQTGEQARFFYQLETGINMPATFDLNADIPSATADIPAGLVSSIEFRHTNGNLISGNQIEMGTNETRNIVVRIPQIPPSFASQSFTLEVQASSGDVEGSDAHTFTVGQPVTPPDPNISVEQTGFEVFDVVTEASDPSGGDLDGSTISLASGKQMIVFFNVQLLAQGDYDLTIQERTGAALSGWTLEVVNPEDASIEVTSDGDSTVHLVLFGVTRSSGATAGGSIVMRIQRQGETRDWHKEFELELSS